MATQTHSHFQIERALNSLLFYPQLSQAASQPASQPACNSSNNITLFSRELRYLESGWFYYQNISAELTQNISIAHTHTHTHTLTYTYTNTQKQLGKKRKTNDRGLYCKNKEIPSQKRGQNDFHTASNFLFKVADFRCNEIGSKCIFCKQRCCYFISSFKNPFF